MAKQTPAGHTEGNARDMIFSAERRFPVRIRIGVPLGGFGQR
jgi:hypothetical protein